MKSQFWSDFRFNLCFVRAGQRLYDKGTHDEPWFFTDLESTTLWLSVVASFLHLGATFANARLAQGAIQQGRIFSQAERVFVTSLNFATFGVDSALLSIGLANLFDKLQKKQLETLDVVQFSMSVFFFTNTLMTPKTATAIINQAQTRHIEQFANSITDQQARATFDRFLEQNKGDGGIKAQSKIVRSINRIDNPDAVFSQLKHADTIKIGGRKGRTFMVGEEKRYVVVSV